MKLCNLDKEKTPKFYLILGNKNDDTFTFFIRIWHAIVEKRKISLHLCKSKFERISHTSKNVLLCLASVSHAGTQREKGPLSCMCR